MNRRVLIETVTVSDRVWDYGLHPAAKPFLLLLLLLLLLLVEIGLIPVDERFLLLREI